jgi:hypothetical protein
MIHHNLTDQWSYTHYTDAEILQFFADNPDAEFPDITSKFNKLKRGEHKADLFRYYHLYVKGGVFMDSDAMIYKPIDSIVKNYRFFSVNSTNIPESIFQGVIGSEPKNPLIYSAFKYFYKMNIDILNSSYHEVCKNLYQLFQYFNGDSSYKLYDEIADKNSVPHFNGDLIVDNDKNVLFRHYWKLKEGIPNFLLKVQPYIELERPTRSKNLLYFCVFYNAEYFKLLNLLMKSMKYYSSTDSFDILIITHSNFKDIVYNISVELGIYIHIFCIDFTTIFQAACARLFIFDYKYINSYETIFYIDTDIIIKADVAPIFNLALQDVLYGIECGAISSPSFGNQFFNFDVISGSTSGINSGTLLFKNCHEVRDLFSRIRGHINAYTDSKAKPPYCMDQPFINYHAINDRLYDNKLLNPHVSLYEGNDAVDNYKTSSVCHFSFPIGNFGHKYDRMCKFLDALLNTEVDKYAKLDIVDKSYSWGSGYICFKANELQTKWGNGSYDILDTYKVRAYWSHHYHILQFNADYSSYISIRTYPRDFEYTSGKLISV